MSDPFRSLPQTESPAPVGPQRRLDLLTGKHTLIAASRECRPDDFRHTPEIVESRECPFCPGNEGLTPPESLRYGADDWLTRVFPNKYPAVWEPGNGMAPHGRCQGAEGAHEVIVESPRHIASFSQLTTEEARSALRVYAARLKHYRDAGFASSYLFKNCGRDAGASLEHVHSQLIALHRVPAPLRQRMRRDYCFRERWGESISSMILRFEQQDARRLLEADDQFCIFAPYASRAPYELRIWPTKVEPAFEQLGRERADRVAEALLRLTRALEAVVENVAYNVIFHTAPWRCRAGEAAPDRWRIDLVPRIARWAGYELGTDEYINPIAPEEAAARLRARL